MVDAIKVTTDKFVFTVTNQVDSNALSVSGTTQTAGDLAALITTVDTVVDAIKVVTDKFAFTVTNEVDSNTLSVSGTAQTAGDLAALLTTIDTVVDAIKVVTDDQATAATTLVVSTTKAGTLSTTQASTNLTEATDDHYIGRTIIFSSGALQDQASDITDYVGVNVVLTFSALTEAPAAGVSFVIV